MRRAFLCGEDTFSGQNYKHRRQQLEDKLHEFVDLFAIKLCAYAVMSNHYHVVLHVRTDIAFEWSDREVIERWHRLITGNALSRQYLANQPLSQLERTTLTAFIALWRDRLTDISLFMRIVNEFVARKANIEDNCSGRFWQGRF